MKLNDLVEAISTNCQTPGAIYSTSVTSSEVKVTVSFLSRYF